MQAPGSPYRIGTQSHQLLGYYSEAGGRFDKVNKRLFAGKSLSQTFREIRKNGDWFDFLAFSYADHATLDDALGPLASTRGLRKPRIGRVRIGVVDPRPRGLGNILFRRVYRLLARIWSVRTTRVKLKGRLSRLRISVCGFGLNSVYRRHSTAGISERRTFSEVSNVKRIDD